jgi:phospholipase D-like protein
MLALERRELAESPQAELAELARIYESKGLSPDLSRYVAEQKTAVVVSAAVQFGLAATAWTDLARRAPAQVRGPKWRWAALIAINYAGPIAYFRWGRRQAAEAGERQQPAQASQEQVAA